MKPVTWKIESKCPRCFKLNAGTLTDGQPHPRHWTCCADKCGTVWPFNADTDILGRPPVPMGVVPSVNPTPLASTPAREFSHYHKPVPTQTIDVYRVLVAFGVADPCLAHAVKKLLVAGGRGTKDTAKDVHEAIASLTRWQEMRKEEQNHVA